MYTHTSQLLGFFALEHCAAAAAGQQRLRQEPVSIVINIVIIIR